jgi:hypothetical protein
MKCANCGGDMIQPSNLGFLRETSMPFNVCMGTLKIETKELRKNVFGKEMPVDVTSYVNPKIYVCKRCGLIQRFLSEDELKLLEE